MGSGTHTCLLPHARSIQRAHKANLSTQGQARTHKYVISGVLLNLEVCEGLIRGFCEGRERWSGAAAVAAAAAISCVCWRLDAGCTLLWLFYSKDFSITILLFSSTKSFIDFIEVVLYYRNHEYCFVQSHSVWIILVAV